MNKKVSYMYSKVKQILMFLFLALSPLKIKELFKAEGKSKGGIRVSKWNNINIADDLHDMYCRERENKKGR